ncbi:septum formation family protein [Catenuloplanes sp. NPDC051500]|uniref:septum formation family protein n=1 Tax=Catenuloplanes sp. NPDC051500 TaxID=3363959 RepID=UPI0037ABA285
MATGEVQVGTCKDKTLAEEMAGFSDSAPAVPCTEPHTLETYGTGTLPDAVKALGPARPGPEILAGVAAEACSYDPIRPYLGATAPDQTWGIEVFVKFPTRAEWTAGVRTVLCDLAVGTGGPPRTVLPLRDALRYTDSARLRMCRAGDTMVTCDLPHDGERAGDVDASGADPDRTARCEDAARAYAGGPVPAAVTLRGGTAECWITGETTTTGTVRAGLVAR